jgi:hypothetical protein
MLPSLLAARQIERRLAVQVIEVRANQRGLLHPDAVVAHEIGDAAGWIDAVVGTVGRPCLRDDRLHPAFQSLLENHDPRHARVGRTGGDVELQHASHGAECTA